MALNIGSNKIGSIYLGSTKIAEAYLGSTKIFGSAAPAPGPSIPAKTVRFRFEDAYDPTSSSEASLWVSGSTWTRVSSSPNVWDYYRDTTDWSREFRNKFNRNNESNGVHVVEANLTGVTSLQATFAQQWGTNLAAWLGMIKSVSKFYAPDATNMDSCFCDIPYLQSVEVTSSASATIMSDMFSNDNRLTAFPTDMQTDRVSRFQYFGYGCRLVTNALAMYQKVSGQATPPTGHSSAFTNCGIDTAYAGDLALIPSSWGGTGA